MKNRIIILSLLIFYTAATIAQVPVSKEPRHHNIFENKYIRVLDVWIQPGDTTLFHMHATPSVFLQFTSTVACIQIKGAAWTKNKNKEGNASYRSFINDTLVHRVSNCDTVPFHVTDIELLSPYQADKKLQPLPFTVLFDNEKAFACRLTAANFNQQIIKGRGPMIAGLVAGTGIIFHDAMANQTKEIKAGENLYIEPGAAFYFTAKGKGEINLVLFEIK